MAVFATRVNKGVAAKVAVSLFDFGFGWSNTYSRFASGKNKRLEIVLAKYRQAQKGIKKRYVYEDVFVRKTFCSPVFHGDFKISLRTYGLLALNSHFGSITAEGGC